MKKANFQKSKSTILMTSSLTW